MEKTKVYPERDSAELLWEKGVKILTMTGYFVSGFILSGAGLLSLKTPFNIGLAAACTGCELIFAALGGILGAVLRLNGGEMLNAIIPQAGICAVIFALDKLGIYKKRRTVLTVSVFLLCLACGTAVMFSEIPSLNELVLTVCSSLLCAASVTFYSGTVNCIKKKRSPYMLDNRSLVCIVASLCTILLGSSEISLLGFRPARFFGCFIILTASYLFSRSGGSIAGIAIGGCIAVSGTGVALSICYGICGLLSGIFSRFGQIVCALVFSVTAGIAALIDGSGEGIAVFAEAASAAVIFAAIPSAKLSRVRGNILNPRAKRISSEFGAAGERLLEASRAIGSVSECVEKVSKGIESLSPANDELICMRVRERVCAACPLKNTFCPEEGEFSEILKKLANGENVSAQDFSVNFNAKCPSVARVAESFNKAHAGTNALNAMQAVSARNRELACGQFDWISRLLEELSTEIGQGAQILFGKEKTAASVLSDNGFEVISVSCVSPPSGAVRLTCIVKDIPASTSLSRLTAELSRELEAELLPPRIREHKDGRELVFQRKELYNIRLGSAAASCGGKKLCGDYFECFRTDSKAYIILSDGMGTGGRAAIDSAMTVELFSRLIRAGISLDTALCITNSALSVKSEDESLSTLDVAEIDLFTGNAVLLKAGAAPSFYTVSGKVKSVEIPSAPLGILSKVKFSRYALRLRAGDTLVMVSDGILGCGSMWVKEEIRAFSGGPDASAFSENLIDSAKLKCGENFDDMTVITIVAEEV
ncbi:MAG: SpoIIE family protein phosphatase [Clostridia bacterium]|nr:SpoIIE family protein phosphatase [Clostridia bacterium]